ncbi:2-oxo acid dehydrogenase subunit E2 [Streptomyces sp. NPDC002896]|uniref:2-oxo acid dehydrogenase subunit E2 n=1 Tax=Streptomyces sp. NPDC002896 TaxID=3154438 RepID=UPI003329EA06
MTGTRIDTNTGTGTQPVRDRRHTLYFLEYAARQRPVHLDTEIDMSAIHAHRDSVGGDRARRYSTVTYVLHAAGRVLHRHPEANAVLARGWPRLLRRPRIVRFPSVTGKLALDATGPHGQRIVLSALVPELETASLDDIQDQVDRYRTRSDRGADPRTRSVGDANTRGDARVTDGVSEAGGAAPIPDGSTPPSVAGLPEFRGVRMLTRLPVWLGRLAFAAALRDARRRPAVLGTVSVSSLGHRPVDGFHSVGGTAVTLTCGRTVPRPVVREDGRIEAAPLMRLGLTFDHRVLDGAAAADVLGDLKYALEQGCWNDETDRPDDEAGQADHQDGNAHDDATTTGAGADATGAELWRTPADRRAVRPVAADQG